MYKRIVLVLIIILSLNVVSDDSAKVQSVNFVQDGEISKLIITLDKPVLANKIHSKEDKQILLDLKNVIADKKFMRKIVTSEFSGAVTVVSPYKKPGSKNDLRFAIQLRDNVRSFIENRNDKITLNIENRFGVFTRTKLRLEKENKKTKLEIIELKNVHIPKSNDVLDILTNLTQSGVKRYVGKKISINVNSVPYQEVLKMIADTSGFNIIIDNKINSISPLTISLTNLPWDQVLDTVMNIGKLVAYRHGNILTMRTAEQAREEKQKELDAVNASKILEPLVTKIFKISYAELESILAILTPYLSKKRGSLQKDDRTRSLIVKDTVDVIERMKKIIENLDTQTPQILIESRVVEVDESYEFKAGLSAGGAKMGYDLFGNSSSSPNGTFSLNSAPTSNAASFLEFSVGAVQKLSNLNFTLDLMESESKGRIVSAPKIVTENNKKAVIQNIMEKNTLVMTSETETSSVQELVKLETKISLSVTPKVTNEGSIALEVQVEKEGFTSQSAEEKLPGRLTNKISTNVLVENGSTVVIGGLYQTKDTSLEVGVPYLKDLPVIGWLFRNSYNPKKERSELIIFLTPRVINQEEAGLGNSELGTLAL